MLGTRLKSWMEAHIVRARKKQNRKGKNDKSSASANQQDEASESKTGGASLRKDSSEYSVGEGAGSRPSMTSDGSKGHLSSESKGHLSSDASKVHLSSPESAYSTGYSTDGTSPGASIPPEYYINLRTGKHYVQASTGNAGVSGAETVAPRSGLTVPRGVGALPPAPPTSPRHAPALTPSSARRRREEALKRKKAEGLPESSTEEDIAKPPSHKITTPKSQRKPNHAGLSHRRTESYDESQRYRVQVPIYAVIDRDSEGSSSTRTTGGSSSVHSNNSNNNNQTSTNNNNYGRPNCTSPFLSSAAASPRQRNRIRTNPWLGVAPGSAPLAAPENDPAAFKNYNSQGETSSTVGSSSTLSSAGRLEVSGGGGGSGGGGSSGGGGGASSGGGGGAASGSTASSPRFRAPPPPPPDHVRIVRSGTYLASPLVNGRRGVVDTVTTCSPQPNRPCRHMRAREHKNSALSLSSSSTLSSEDDVARHPGRQHPGKGSSPSPSDLSEDDLTLNEMGKYDESYVYEKETDILSDSDPTDCDDPHHNHSGKMINKGHCTYVGGFGTPEASVKMKRRSRARRQKSDDRASSSGGGLTRNMSEGSRKSHSGSNMSTPTRRCRRRRSARATPVYDEHQALQESPVMSQRSLRGRSPNLNRLLVDRLMTGGRPGGTSPVPQAPLGSRSADCTPISLRKHSSFHHHSQHSHHHHHHHHHHHQHELNGKVLKNPHVSKLISSSNCPSPSVEPKYIRADPYSPVLIKRRSNSLSVGGSNYFTGPAPTYLPPVAPARAMDNDGDVKYRRLIREAETLLVTEQQATFRNPKTPPSALSPFHKTGYSPRNLGKPVPTPTLPPPPYTPYIPEIESAINNNPPPITSSPAPVRNKTVPRAVPSEEGNFLKTISKTLERIMIRNTKDKDKKSKLSNVENLKEPNYPNNNTVGIPSPLTYQTLGGVNGLDVFNDEEDGFIAVTIQAKNSDITNHNEEPCYVNNVVEGLQSAHPMHSLCIVDRDNNDNVFPGPTFTTFGHGNDQNPSPKVSQNGDDCPPPRKPNRKLGLTLWKEGQLSSPNRDKFTRKDEAVSTPKTPLIPFEAFDLVGRPQPEVTAPVTSPLPQSEPVKRKVYACSSTFDRLQKSLMLRGDHDPEHVSMMLKNKYSTDPVDVAAMSTEALRDENLSLKEKVEQLRKRRMEVEERVRTTQAQIDRLRAADVTKGHYGP